MSAVVLRRFSSLALRRTFNQSILHHHFPAGGRDLIRSGPTCSDEFRSFFSLASKENPFGNRARNFHVKSGPSDFRASVMSQAEVAVQDFADYDYSNSPDEGFDGSGSDEGLEISKLGISPEIVKALSGRGISKLFPIQKAVLEPAMQGRDMIGRARTGTGKTLAFGIPVIDRIIKFNAKHGRGKNPLCLVLAPTRELARQVEKEFRESAPSLDTICIYGGMPIGSQMRELGNGVDVAVGTPGRLIDLMKRGALNLSEVQYVVIDEADQMLQVGFAEDVDTILEQLPKNRQSMMFSATMPSWIRNLTKKHLKNPLTIDLVGDSDQKLADGISLYSVASDTYGKASILGPLITEHAKGGKCIVFTQTKRDADRLAHTMARSFKCEALHGDISQSQRERTLASFRAGRFSILVATDVASRGLDIPNVDLVIHYELANNSETFVHRTGRTGRAGKKGSAILIYSQQQARSVKLIEREVGCRFTELPKIAVDRGVSNMFNDMGTGPRSGSFGGMSDSEDSGFGQFGKSDFRRGGRFGGYGKSQGSGRSGGYGGMSDSEDSGFGQFGKSDSRRGGRSGGYGKNQGSGRSGSGGYGGSFSDKFGGSDRFGSSPSRSRSFGGSGTGRSGGFSGRKSDRSSGGSRGRSRGGF